MRQHKGLPLSSNLSLILMASAIIVSFLFDRLGFQRLSDIGAICLAAIAVFFAAHSLLKSGRGRRKENPGSEIQGEETGRGGSRELSGAESSRLLKLETFGQIMAGLGHELNNYLTVVLANSELLKRKQPPTVQQQELEGIEHAAAAAARTLKNATAFFSGSRIQRKETVSIRRLIEEALDLASGVWKKKGQASSTRIALETAIEDTYVAGNVDELREVLVNLIINAVDAMPAGGRLRIESVLSGMETVISVVDTGVGIAPENLERIFDPFFTTKPTEGTGLGLAIARSTIERHGGRIVCHSKQGEGSTFTIRLPIKEAGSLRAAIAAEPLEMYRPRARRERILVVDDEPAVLRVMAGMLEAEGHQVLTFRSGLEAIAAAQRSSFDVVVTDLIMPEISGFEVVEQIKRINPQMGVVVITGWSAAAATPPEELKLKGVDVLCVKPFSADELLRAVESASR